jgi:lipopolysaccharide export system permease protein
MVRNSKISISKYLSYNFTKSFLTIFLPLFFIGALVFIVKISALTASIQVDFFEMMQLFSYNLPAILFYTLPISFLVATVVTFLRLSTENELMALFALGVQSKNVVRRFFIIALLFTILLLSLSLAMMPQTKQQFSAFKQQKATQAQLNINPSQLGQKFGDLFIYVKSKNEEGMKNVVIYNKDHRNGDQLFIAKKAKIENQDAIVTLTLSDGSGYTFDKGTLKEINYETMQVFQNLNSDAFTYKNIFENWINLHSDSKTRGSFIFFIYISFIPLMTLYIVASFSIINPRYQKNHAYPLLGISTVGIYTIATLLEKQANFAFLIIALLGTSLLGFILFRRHVSRFF